MSVDLIRKQQIMSVMVDNWRGLDGLGEGLHSQSLEYGDLTGNEGFKESFSNALWGSNTTDQGVDSCSICSIAEPGWALV